MIVEAARVSKRVGRAWPLIALALSMASAGILAATPEVPAIGAADLVVSEVRGLFGGITRELAVKDNVYSEEVIGTEVNAATRIVFLDGTELSMGPSSRVVLDRYVYDPKAGVGEMALRMVTGVFEFASGSMPASGYDVRTPFGNLAIRGTRCTLDIQTGQRAVATCSELDEPASFAGQLLDDSEDCVFVPLPGTGNPVYLEPDECSQEFERAIAMAALLGVPPSVPTVAPFGPSLEHGPGDDAEPPPTPPLGVSPQ